jgi:hypothetical protein
MRTALGSYDCGLDVLGGAGASDFMPYLGVIKSLAGGLGQQQQTTTQPETLTQVQQALEQERARQALAAAEAKARNTRYALYGVLGALGVAGVAWILARR